MPLQSTLQLTETTPNTEAKPLGCWFDSNAVQSMPFPPRVCDHSVAKERSKTPKSRYKRIRLGKGVTRDQHRIVMESILGRRLEKDEIVHHVNGNGRDNRPENLEVLTRAEHSRLHRINGDTGVMSPEAIERQRRRYQGEGSPMSKLKAGQIPAILEWIRLGASSVAIGQRYGVSESAIRDIRDGYSWNHLTGLPRREKGKTWSKA